MRNFVTPKVVEFRKIPYMRNIRDLKKTYGIPYRRNSENTLSLMFLRFLTNEMSRTCRYALKKFQFQFFCKSVTISNVKFQNTVTVKNANFHKSLKRTL
jgi:hypothetical protein